MNKQDKIIRASVIEQPLEGLLYDLDLMPEQCRSTTANMRRIAIEELREEIERLRIERDYWKTTLIAELEENESGDGVDNEMHEHEKALQQALKESGR